MTGTQRRQDALKEVENCVCKDRQSTHGDAEHNFHDIAKLWSTYTGTPLTPQDVAAMMILVKIARMRSSPDHRDNWIDAAGYAICGAGITQAKQTNTTPTTP